MRKFLIILLAILFPCLGRAAFVGNYYTTNSQFLVDAWVSAMVAPGTGISAATATNIVLGMSETLVTHGATNGAYGGNILTNMSDAKLKSLTVTNPGSGSFIGAAAGTTTGFTLGASNHVPYIVNVMPVQTVSTEVAALSKVATNLFVVQSQGDDPFIGFYKDSNEGVGFGVMNVGCHLSAQNMIFWTNKKFWFCSQATGVFANNYDLEVDIENGVLRDGNTNVILNLATHDYYDAAGTTKMLDGTTHVFTGNASGLTNLYVGTTAGRIPVTTTAGILTNMPTLLYDSTLNQMIINENAVVGPVTIVGTALAIKGADGQPVRINTSSFGNGVGAYANAHARGTAGTPAAVQSGDQLMSLEGLGYVETDYPASPNVMMRGYAANTYNPSNQGSYMQFWITATNATVPRVALTIDAAGRLNGDGTGLSNVTASAYPAPSLPVFTNLNSGELYSNVTATPILIIARAEARFMDTLVGVASTAEIDLVVNGLFTNSVSIDRNNGASTSTTGGHTATLSAIVPTNTFYWFTNVSVGAGGNPTGFVYQPIIIMPQR